MYSLAVQQLSKQDHYDFGLRALTSVLRYAGKKKRANPNMSDEEVLFISLYLSYKLKFQCPRAQGVLRLTRGRAASMQSLHRTISFIAVLRKPLRNENFEAFIFIETISNSFLLQKKLCSKSTAKNLTAYLLLQVHFSASTFFFEYWAS